ncbi:hypothetical protein [Hymenobacter negativus]|uniref:Uncharacterized protein n=1 Tax=Hymenobacter negativus TaxID=2795026 RepID=A0ABS3QAG5_9BACT|nr:hypothetical protein [Hymenobacter negativus]MBO2008106.1 hypothetical protein [Hymenobacter negativus]
MTWLSAKANVETTLSLGESHGRVHLLPAERTKAVESSYLQVGSSFVGHPYTDRVQCTYFCSG